LHDTDGEKAEYIDQKRPGQDAAANPEHRTQRKSQFLFRSNAQFASHQGQREQNKAAAQRYWHKARAHRGKRANLITTAEDGNTRANEGKQNSRQKLQNFNAKQAGFPCRKYEERNN
jgi:hypothetical protein